MSLGELSVTADPSIRSNYSSINYAKLSKSAARCGVVPAILRWSCDVRSPFPDIRRTRRRRGAPGEPLGVSRGTGAEQVDRIRDPPRRSAAKRICRAVRGAAGLADRLYR